MKLTISSVSDSYFSTESVSTNVVGSNVVKRTRKLVCLKRILYSPILKHKKKGKKSSPSSNWEAYVPKKYL